MVFGLFSGAIPYKGQKYNDLKKAAQQSGHPFIDPEFPPDDKSLFGTPGKLAGIEWKRPKDICENPKLFVEGADSNDVSQGALGNCWFVAASSCLAGDKEIWSKVIPDHQEQEWDDEHPEKYAGIFHFHFWRYGEWLDVVIDDFLPVRSGELVFVHSKSKNEFWSALLEKAYAKLFGNYEALDGGELAEALEDFTGGVAEPIDLVAGGYAEDEQKREELFKVMKKAHDYRALEAAAIPAKSSDEMEQATEVGLVKGHAYGITAIKRCAIAGSGLFNMFNREKLSMIRLRNPWGGSEWKGAFSDGSEEWNRIDKSVRESIGLTFDEDGEFWMTMDDYCKYFTSMSICRVVNTSMFSLQKKWHSAEMHSQWSTPTLSGGCINNKDTFLQNPQFVFDVKEKEDEVLFALTQKAGRKDKSEKSESVDKLTIGFTIMKVEENRYYRCHQMQQVVKSSAFKNARSIFLRHTLKKGCYVLVGCTFEPGHNSGLLLRIFTSAVNHGFELVQDKPGTDWRSFFCCAPCAYPSLMTRITVLGASGLEKQDNIGGADPYVIIKCEGEQVRSPSVTDTVNPEWHISAIFYRRQPVSKPIKIEIWNDNTLRDDFMGQAIIECRDECEDKAMQLPLTGRKSEKTQQKPGKLVVQITTSRDLMLL